MLVNIEKKFFLNFYQKSLNLQLFHYGYHPGEPMAFASSAVRGHYTKQRAIFVFVRFAVNHFHYLYFVL